MGFLDSIFGKRKHSQTNGDILGETEPQKEVQSEHKEDKNPLKPFEFISNNHQRYQNGSKVMGLQQCTRTVKVEQNTHGCRGYKLRPGDGYIVKIFNDDLGEPNMSDKPMRIESASKDKVELRGFPIEAQTPFGWQEVDYSDYGFTIHYDNGKVCKCVLHMYDRDVDIEYRKNVDGKDRYAQMIDQSGFNPFNLTTDPRLQNQNRLPNFRPVFIRELSSMLGNQFLRNVQSQQDIVKGYIFNLVESYYNNAGYVPKNTLDEILGEVYKALVEMGRQSIFPSEDNLRYQMYYCFLNN